MAVGYAPRIDTAHADRGHQGFVRYIASVDINRLWTLYAKD